MLNIFLYLIMAFDGYINLLVVNEQANREQQREVRILQRQLRDTSNPFNLPDALFLKIFRLNKYCCEDLINSLWPHMNHPRRATRVPVHLRVLTALHFFGQGSYQSGIGHSYSIAESQPAVSRCITEVTDAITNNLLNIWISFPNTDQARDALKGGFQNITPTFPNLIGVVDGTHIRIISPPIHHPIHPGQAYYCRKHFYAINTQIVGDCNRKILSINARFPGSVHDSAIWMLSAVKRIMQQEYVANGATNYLIGDGGYPLEPWLLIPFLNPAADTPKSRYNTALSHVRVIIEHINGLLKSRFRCLHGHRALHYNPIRAAKIIYSCAVLHNMCRTYNVPMPNDEDVLPRPPRLVNQPAPNHDPDWFIEGTRIRQQIVNTFL